MIAVPSDANIFLYSSPTDMRKSFDGLSGIVRSELGQEPTDGSWFLFINRRQDRIKILHWDRDGLALWYKRLEAGTFERVRGEEGPAVRIDTTELSMLLGGMSLGAAKRRKRFTSAA